MYYHNYIVKVSNALVSGGTVIKYETVQAYAALPGASSTGG